MLNMMTKVSYQPENSITSLLPEEQGSLFMQTRLTFVGNKLLMQGGFSGVKDRLKEFHGHSATYTIPRIRLHDRWAKRCYCNVLKLDAFATITRKKQCHGFVFSSIHIGTVVVLFPN